MYKKLDRESSEQASDKWQVQLTAQNQCPGSIEHKPKDSD
jgi:hypothetical protein